MESKAFFFPGSCWSTHINGHTKSDRYQGVGPTERKQLPAFCRFHDTQPRVVMADNPGPTWHARLRPGSNQSPGAFRSCTLALLPIELSLLLVLYTWYNLSGPNRLTFRSSPSPGVQPSRTIAPTDGDSSVWDAVGTIQLQHLRQLLYVKPGTFGQVHGKNYYCWATRWRLCWLHPRDAGLMVSSCISTN